MKKLFIKIKDKILGFVSYLIDLIIKRPVHAFKVFCFWIGLSVVLSTVIIGLITTSFYLSLPSGKELAFSSLKKRAIKKVSGKLDFKLKSVPYKWTPISKISRDVIYTIVYSEDVNYFKHDGFNLDATLRSMMINYKKQKLAQGGSTITQQLAKNLFLTHSKSFTRKLKEFFIAKRLEAALTKNEILELYLNTVELGPALYGIYSGGIYYFKKKPELLNAAEGVFLALLLPSPRRYHYALYQNKNITEPKKKKMRRVLLGMHFDGLISKKQYNQYIHYEYFKNFAKRKSASK